jgi:hypothetical protein
MCHQHYCLQQQAEPADDAAEPADDAAEPADDAAEPANSAAEPAGNENTPEVVMRKIFDLFGTIDNAVDAVVKSVDDDVLHRMLLGTQSSVLKVLLKAMRQLYSIAHKV